MNASAHTFTLPRHDREVDIFDLWVQRFPDADEAVVTAFFKDCEAKYSHNASPYSEATTYMAPEFVGMQVERDGVIIVYTRDQAEALLSRDDVNEIEENERRLAEDAA